MKTRCRVALTLLLATLTMLACSGSGDASRQAAQSDLRRTFDVRAREVLERVTATTGHRIIAYEPINDTVLTRKVTINADYYALGYQTGLMAREIGISPRRRTEADRALNEQIVALYADPPRWRSSTGAAGWCPSGRRGTSRWSRTRPCRSERTGWLRGAGATRRPRAPWHRET
jgi:hypothetical protein